MRQHVVVLRWRVHVLDIYASLMHGSTTIMWRSGRCFNGNSSFLILRKIVSERRRRTPDVVMSEF
jgi:hypothetical protein